jgi:uncharacterized membrane protein
MKARSRRALQAILYEAIAVGFVGPGLAYLAERSATTTVPLAMFMSSFALGWSFVFNTVFERWEARQSHSGRTLMRRIAHACGFEGGLVVMLVPVMAWWMQTSLWSALVADLAVLAFFFVYAFVFTWLFDLVFGLPAATTGCNAAPGSPDR